MPHLHEMLFALITATLLGAVLHCTFLKVVKLTKCNIDAWNSEVLAV